ncbi:hypothetical protein KUTeg_021436 [Tegillarca granosa]|uniref:Uncharacterized protein n=1 Tax=Tegillarca granosa TaxID=220873 RepID=A0ABQ9E3R2_TEGGR|nr:hypothetical protein KUTeg_021436 [Tegillarca granosa]
MVISDMTNTYMVQYVIYVILKVQYVINVILKVQYVIYVILKVQYVIFGMGFHLNLQKATSMPPKKKKKSMLEFL